MTGPLKPTRRPSMRTRSNLAADSPRIAIDVLNLAWLYRDRIESKRSQAEPLFERALAIREKSLGPDAPQVAEVLSDEALALLLRAATRARCLNRFYARWRFRKRRPATDSLRSFDDAESSWALPARSPADSRKPKPRFTRALGHPRESNFRLKMTWIAISLENLASVYVAQRDFNKAVAARSSALTGSGRNQRRPARRQNRNLSRRLNDRPTSAKSASAV